MSTVFGGATTTGVETAPLLAFCGEVDEVDDVAGGMLPFPFATTVPFSGVMISFFGCFKRCAKPTRRKFLGDGTVFYIVGAEESSDNVEKQEKERNLYDDIVDDNRLVIVVKQTEVSSVDSECEQKK